MRIQFRIPEGERETLVETAQRAASRRHFDASLPWPGKLHRIGITVDGDCLNTRTRDVQRAALHAVHYYLGPLRIIGRGIDKEGGGRQDTVVFRRETL